MPAAKATCAKPAVEAAETEEELAAALSALLKKGHAARTNALLKDDCELSQHIIREAERAGLDANMLLAVYMGVVAHVLNPCTLTQRYILSTPSCTPPVLISSMSCVLQAPLAIARTRSSCTGLSCCSGCSCWAILTWESRR